MRYRTIVAERARYRTIVADPPWPQGPTGVRFGVGLPPTSSRGKGTQWQPIDAETVALPYATLTLAEIAALPVQDFAANDAHLYLWTTQKFLRDSFAIADAWGFEVAVTLTWCKAPRGMHTGGTFRSSLEFCHFCRRGSLPAKTTIDRRWFTWPRIQGPSVGRGEQRQFGHSAKPEAFLDMVEQVSPGPYVELFARRDRLGWDTWGNESLATARLAFDEDRER